LPFCQATLKKLRTARKNAGVVVSTPSAVKSLMLRYGTRDDDDDDGGGDDDDHDDHNDHDDEVIWTITIMKPRNCAQELRGG
jgi:ABC-type Zn2+ transport system substrate-binding protein/surface adhesin